MPVVDAISHQKLLVSTCLLKNVNCKEPVVVTVKDYLRADDTSALDYLETCFDKFVTLDNVDVMWRTFKEMVTHCEANYIPNKTKRKLINRTHGLHGRSYT